jgi:hypothetical protein
LCSRARVRERVQLTRALARARARAAPDLDLDVPRVFDVALEEEGRIAKGRERLAHRGGHASLERGEVAHDAHALAAAAHRGLDHERVAHLVGEGDRLLDGAERV